MASQNILLGAGLSEIQPIVEHKKREQQRTPAWRYHKDCPSGKLIKYDDELDEADANNWVDHPGKVTRLPGFEKMYDNFHDISSITKKENMSINQVNSNCPTVKINDGHATLTSEQIEEAKKADALKKASDLIEQKRLEKDEKAKNLSSPIEYQCPICPKKFPTIRALNMHGLGAHTNKKDTIPEKG